MRDVVQNDRAMNKSDSFKRDRRRMIERVNVIIKADPNEDGGSNSDENAAEPEQERAGGRSPQTKAAVGLTNQDMLMVAQAQSS